MKIYLRVVVATFLTTARYGVGKVPTIRRRISIYPNFAQSGPIKLTQHRLSRLLISLACALLLAPVTGYCITISPVDPCQGNPAGPCTGVDDDNTAHVFTLAKILQQANLINFGMRAFVDKHPGWSYHWASRTDVATVWEGISVLDYYAWVVTEPDPATSAPPTDPDNYYLGIDPILKNNGNFNDVGGAILSLSYTPVAGAPVIADLHWVQAVSGSLYRQQIKFLDNDFDPDSPFYDTNFTAGALPNGGGWFFDRPWQLEQEYEDNPVTYQSFQVALASYDSNTDTVILYGALNWGYRYTAGENPPISMPEAGNTLVLLFVGTIGVTMLSSIRGFRAEFRPARKAEPVQCDHCE